MLHLLLLIFPLAWGNVIRNPMENPDLFQGDIIGIEDANDRNAIATNERRWPNGVIPYKIDKGLDDLKDEIAKAMKHIMDRTCIKFVPWDGLVRGYIKLIPGDGCYSLWGYTGRIQVVSLGYGCEPLGTIIHELMHAIGFEHEQNRSDRDDYILIYWNNIKPEAIDQFDKLKPDENRLLTGFDYNSIMMYGEKTFSRDGFSKTMLPRKKGIKLLSVAQKGKLSDSDVIRINKLYECEEILNKNLKYDLSKT